MPFRLRRRRPLQPTRRRGLIAVAAVLLLTLGSIAAVLVGQRGSGGGLALIAHHGAVAASDQLNRGGTPPDDVFDPIAAALPSAAPATAPALPGDNDPRLRAIPHLPALAVGAGPHAVNVPILMYHFLRAYRNPNDALGWRLSVTPTDFALQLALLKREGFTAVSLGDVVNAVEEGKALPARPIVLTFDDGYRNFATVGAPLLHAAGFTATSFVVSGFVGRPGFMTADDIRQIAGMGFTIGAHSEHHVNLARVPIGVAQQEIAGSRAALQKLSGQPVTDFAYPSGQFDQQVVELVQQAGFQDAVTTVSGVRHASGLDYTMTRVRVSGGESLLAFAQSIAGSSSAPAAAQAAPSAPTLPASVAPAAAEPRTPGARGVRPS